MSHLRYTKAVLQYSHASTFIRSLPHEIGGSRIFTGKYPTAFPRPTASTIRATNSRRERKAPSSEDWDINFSSRDTAGMTGKFFIPQRNEARTITFATML